MNHFRTFALLPFLLFALSPFHPFTLDLTAQTTGKEFWICIPPNDLDSHPTRALEVYVASDYDTKITVYDASTGRSYERKVTAGEICTLTDTSGETSWSWEVREFEQPVSKGIRITSPDPIAVYVLNSKEHTSDGFRAYPTSVWGTKYIVAAYSDCLDFYSLSGGFCIIAKEPTTVAIKLQGIGGDKAKTSGGKEIGDSITIDLKEGEVYAVCGDGTTKGDFDLTGTIITSTRPVGVFGFHQGTIMPNKLYTGNHWNHLVEMLPPTNMWGKKYSTTEFIRRKTKPISEGDMFRIIASEPNTEWFLYCFDSNPSIRFRANYDTLAKAGDFVDLAQSIGPTSMPRGFTLVTADKPILVVQYSNSSTFDGGSFQDPFMITLVPDEQFVLSAAWKRPAGEHFTKHFLNLIVKADTADPNYMANLKSIEIDNTPLSMLPIHIVDDLHWATVEFVSPVTSHKITSNGSVTLSGYVYGYGFVDAYGWPLASGTKGSNITDTMPPLVSGTGCGTFTATATELRNIPDPPRSNPQESDQLETGIAEIDTVAGANSYNYRLQLVTDNRLPRYPSYKQFRFIFDVIDASHPAYCVYFVKDWANNIVYDTLRYTPLPLVLTPDSVRFGRTRVNVRDTISVSLMNTGVDPIKITTARLDSGRHFRLINGISPPGITIGEGQTKVLNVVYLADRESIDALTDLDRDILLVTDQCATWKVPISGMATQPRISVQNYHVGLVALGLRTCKSDGLRITNDGTDTLVITDFTGYEGTNFSVTQQARSALPYLIPPKASYVMRDVCYQRFDYGVDSISVLFHANASGPKYSSLWNARTTTTSVEEDRPSSFNISTTSGSISATWKGAGVTRIAVWDVVGRQIHEVFVDADRTDCTFESTLPSQQTVLIVFYSADGSPLHTAKEIMP